MVAVLVGIHTGKFSRRAKGGTRRHDEVGEGIRQRSEVGGGRRGYDKAGGGRRMHDEAGGRHEEARGARPSRRRQKEARGGTTR